MRILYFIAGIIIATLAVPMLQPQKLKVVETNAPAPACGEFTPMITPAYTPSPFTQVHFFPKHCNKIMIAGALETIPAGVGVISGGVVGDVTHACIDKSCSKHLAANTLYRVYVYMEGRTMKMDFSTGGHKEDPTFGNEVHVADPSRSLVGMIRTNDKGLIMGTANEQMTISWFNRGETGLALEFGGATSCSDTMVPMPDVHLAFLTFGINDTFKQAFTVPNVYFSGSVANSKAGGGVNVAIAINGKSASRVGEYFQNTATDIGAIQTQAIGAGGSDEGYVKAVLMLSNGGKGGCATVRSGTLYTSPLQS